ncbi:hypothetical protein GGF44_001953 [Coemansia sp. RSA 1694]|nr:hypothetical protein GGF44_001953 [Coemansia sp. RSA 1694]
MQQVAIILLALLASATALGPRSRPTPVVVWHGMGDTCCDNTTMGVITSIIRDELPGAFVHSVQLGASMSADRNAGFFGNINNQIDAVCSSLSAIEELQDGVNLMGFSQGGLFLRALVQRCPTIRAKVLVTFGSPHGGVAKIPECASSGDTLCQWMRQLASKGVYSWYIRDHVIQAQYFKDPERIDQYLQYNIFLPDINGDLEEEERNDVYRKRILALDKMVLFKFSEDKMIYPAMSPWFGFVDADGSDVPVQNTTMYKRDWLGLRGLEEAGKLSFISLDGPHMHIGEDVLRNIVSEHFGASEKVVPFYVQDGAR